LYLMLQSSEKDIESFEFILYFKNQVLFINGKKAFKKP
jgi:hypothetical protein